MFYKIGVYCLIMEKISNKKQCKLEDFEQFTKEELIEKIKSVLAHNIQLKNILANSSKTKRTEPRESKPFDFAKHNFRHIALKLFYLGWNYKGFVVQEDTNSTVEHELFDALIKTRLIKDRASSNYHRCGRTDKGVSSFGQVISIDVRSNLPNEKQEKLSEELNYCKLLNKVLPDSIQCVAWSPVDSSFSARFECKSRTYKYYFPKGKLNIEKMKSASEKLIGTHDFRNFCKMDVRNGVVEFIRRISEIDIVKVNTEDFDDEYSMYVISVKGKAFLWHQIRCIMEILLSVGQNKEDPSIIDELLDVEKHSRKPEYGMASEIPLNLYFCEYGEIKWHYEETSLKCVIEKLNAIWVFDAVKENMVKDMITALKQEYETLAENTSGTSEKCVAEVLSQGFRAKTYIPILRRQTSDSLENKLISFRKRKRTEIVLSDNGDSK